MHYLIDGHNLIAAMANVAADISLEDPDDEIKLILVLKSWAVARQKRIVTVIFDGGLPGGYQKRLSTSRINVVFAQEGQTADALLIHRIKQVPNPPEFTLVSSDRKIQEAANKRKMTFIPSDDFARQLVEKKKPPQPVKPESEEPVLSSKEVAEWMELFGPEPEIVAPPKPAKRKTVKKKKSTEPTQQDKSPGTVKRGERKLSRDEVDEWLDLFGSGGGKK